MLLKVPPERKKIKERTLTETEIETLFDAAAKVVEQAPTSHKKIQAQRNQLILELFYYGAIRVGESSLTWATLHQSGRQGRQGARCSHTNRTLPIPSS